ncbi:helix-turn-helix transcriptional regulator [Changchengzhania lutea]|uniref:helix-turn-helix transcriptional regulator n=1 Tax=Changchengzhania lutea TaxID=2049305 RepID=UPI00115EF357|nr:AraC family transcriptional regulator [Changchengzhania lutea]
MHEIVIKNSNTENTIRQLSEVLDGHVVSSCGEFTLTFDNKYGHGVIRGIDFDWGLSLIDFDVTFKEVTKIIFVSQNRKLVEFIFVSEGSLEFGYSTNKELSTFNRYQNIIISDKKAKRKTFVFPKDKAVKTNIIQLDTSDYLGKKNNNIKYLDKVLSQLFNKENDTVSYQHLGNYNLKIADQIKQMSNSHDEGIIRTLSIEGQINLIMAMQILEHQNFQSKTVLPDTLSSSHIKKIHELTSYISDNLSEPLSVTALSTLSGLGPKKLQSGFQVLFSKSVNEYIRDLKLEVARDQLLKTDLTISEIVYGIGLRSRSYFSKIFIERYGILPSQYRTEIKSVSK